MRVRAAMLRNCVITAVALLGLTTCSEPLSMVGGNRGVLVIAVDALRQDHLSVPKDNYDRDTTPFLRSFAQSGVSFANAWSTAPDLLPAHMSILTGCDPRVSEAPDIVSPDGRTSTPIVRWVMPDKVPRLALEFLASGWATAAFVDHPQVRGLRGFDRGFRDFLDFGGDSVNETTIGFRGVGFRFFQWLRARRTDENWFAYVHMNDLDRIWGRLEDDFKPKYEPRPSMDGVPPIGRDRPIMFAVPRDRWDGKQYSLGEYEAIYDSAISTLDRNIERLLGHLAEFDCWDQTTVVIVGTYGFGFGESGMILDHGTLSEVDLHVPLLVRPPADSRIEPGWISNAVVSLTDVAPSLLELAGIRVPSGMHGKSLAGLLHGNRDRLHDYVYASSTIFEGFAVIDDRYLFESSRYGSRGRSAMVASWFGDNLPHRDELTERLRDRLDEPSVARPVETLEDPAVADRMRAAGLEHFSLMERAQAVLHLNPFGADKKDPEEVAELQRLGVIGD